MWGFVMSLNLERDSARSKKRLSISLLLCATIMFVMVLLIVSNPVYAVPHQTLTFSYSVSGGGSGYTAPTLSRTVNNVSTNIALTGTPTAYLTDTGTPWSVTNPLTDSDPSEHWQTSETTSGTVSTDLTIGFTYYNQYNVTFDASSNVKLDSAATIVTVAGAAMTAADVPYSGWFNSGSSLSYAYSTTVASTASPTETQYRWGSTSGLDTLQTDTLTVSGAGTITGNYVTQYDLKFAESGLDSSAEGTIVSVTVGSSPAVNVVQNDFPYDFGYVDAGTTVTYAFTSPVASSNSGERFVLTTPVATPASGFSLSGVTTVTGTYGTQYQLTLSSAHDTPTGADWYDAGSTPTIGMTDTAVSGGAGIQYVFTGWSSSDTGSYTGTDASHSVTMNNPITETASWNTQYLVTFTQTGITSDAGSNTVLTLGGSNYAYDALPAGVWVDSGTSFSWASNVAGATGERFVYTGDSGLFSPITASGTDAATYGTQYLVTFTQTGITSDAGSNTVLTLGGSNYAYDALPAGVWVDSGTSFSWASDVAGATGERFVYTGDDSGLVSPIVASGTDAATYKIQYDLKFAESGLDGTAEGTIVSVTVGSSPAVNVVQNDFPYDFGYVDAGTTITYTFTTTVSSSNSGEQFALTTPDASPASGFSLSGATTITGTYKTQYLVSFIQSGSSVAPTVTYTADTDPTTAVPFTVWVKAGTSITFAYQTTVSGTTGVQYVLTGTNVTSPQTVNAPLTILGSYLTQYYLTLSYSVSGGSGYSAPTFTANQLGSPYGQVLTTSATGYWFDAGSSWTETNPLGGSGGTERWETSQAVSGSVSSVQTIAFTYYHQFQITPYYTVSDSSSPTVTNVVGYTQFGGGLTVTPTLGASGGSAVWVDAGSSVTYMSPISGALSSERWMVTLADSGTYIAVSSVDSAQDVTAEYWHQYQVIFEYTVSGGGSPTAPTSYYTQFGGALTKSAATDTSVSDWVDAGSAVTYTNSLADSTGTERWQTDLSIVSGVSTIDSDVAASETLNPLYYHQFLVTFEYTVSDVSPTTDPSVAYVQFGSPLSVDATTSGASVWADATSTWTYDNPTVNSGSSERWIASATPTGTVSVSETENPTYYHQYFITFGYGDNDSSVITSGSLIGSYYQFGSSNEINSGLSYGLTSPGSDWVDASSGMVSYQTYLSGSGTERWALSSSPDSMDVSRSATLSESGYHHQYQVSFHESGLDSDAGSNTVLTVGSTNYTFSSFAVDNIWVDNGTTFTWESTVSGGSGKQFVKTEESGLTSPITTSGTSTATYKTQYWIVFRTSGVGSDYSAVDVFTVNGTGYDRLGTAFWADDGSPQTFVYASSLLVHADQKQYVLTGVNETSALIVSGSETVTGTYKTQYWTVFRQEGVGGDYSAADVMTVNTVSYDRAGTAFWADSGDLENFTYSTPLLVTLDKKQYVLTGVNASTGFTVSDFETVTGVYKAQYKVTFAQSGLTSDASGTVVTVDSVDKAYGDLPFTTDWIDSGSSVTYSYSSPVASTGSPTDTQYRWASTSGLDTLQTDTLTVSGAGTVTGTYVTQYKVTFAQSGLTSDASGTVVTVDNVDKAYGDLPFSKWVDNSSSVSFSYSASVSSSVTSKQYVLTEISGNATSSPLTVNSAVTVIGNYETQYFITVNANGHGSPTEVSTWVPAGSDFTVSVTAPDVVDATHQWNLTGLVVDGSPATWNDSVTFYGVAGAHSVEFDWTENFYITVVSAHGSPTASAWVDQGAGLTVSVSSPADDNGAGTRYRCTGYTLDASTPVTDGTTNYVFTNIQSAQTITFNWIAQYKMTFAQSGLSSDASGTVITVFSDAKTFSELPNSTWVDSGTDVDFSYSSIVGVDAGKQYVLTGVSGNTTASSVTVSNTVTVTGAYKTQYYVIFSTSSVDSDFSETVMTINGTGYDRNGYSAWVDSGSSTTFSYSSPLVVNVNQKRYVLTGVNESSPLIVNNFETVTGSYKTQYYLTNTLIANSVNSITPSQTSDSWYDNGTDVYTVLNYVWDATASQRSNLFSYTVDAVTNDVARAGSGTFDIPTFTMNAPHSVSDASKTQYYVTFAQSGVGSDFSGSVMTVGGTDYDRL